MVTSRVCLLLTARGCVFIGRLFLATALLLLVSMTLPAGTCCLHLAYPVPTPPPSMDTIHTHAACCPASHTQTQTPLLTTHQWAAHT
jgi:hypothetical protein